MKRRLLVPLLILVVSPWLVGTTPSLPRYQFHVKGNVLNTDGTQNSSAIVRMMGWYLGTYEQIKSTETNPSHEVATIAMEGAYDLQAITTTLYDSICVLVTNSQDTILGQPISIELAQKSELTSLTGNGGCFSSTYDSHHEADVYTFYAPTIILRK